jgi:hypothetical protein
MAGKILTLTKRESLNRRQKLKASFSCLLAEIFLKKFLENRPGKSDLFNQ